MKRFPFAWTPTIEHLGSDRVLKHAVNMIAIAGISLAVVAICAPNIEASRIEARTIQTYNEVHRLRDEYVGDIPSGRVELDEHDVWGNAYVAEPAENGQIHIRSAGSNGRFESNTDGDDIWSDMPTSPMQPFRTRKNREWMRAFAAGIAVCCLLVWAYWRSVRAQGD